MKYSIFILSSGRANEMTTYDVLRKHGYTGDIKVVIDDMDEQKDLYLKRYGDDVYIFDKQKSVSVVDAMVRGDDLRSVVFARNEAENIAVELGLDYYAEFDDDVTNFSYKFERDGRLKTKSVKNMDGVVNAILDFMDSSLCDSVGICHTGKLFGGLNGVFSNGYGRNFNQVVFIKTGSRISFKGVASNDTNGLILNSKIGKVMIELYCVTHDVVERGKIGGGLQTLYSDMGIYSKRFLAIIANPDCVFMDENEKLHIMQKNAFPLILKRSVKK